MYNRYIPQPDGSYQRNRVPDQSKPNTNSHTPTEKFPEEAQRDTGDRQVPHVTQQRQSDTISQFFRNLLPKHMDTGDLIIILLLLLIANDCENDRNHALLTLALYFFL